MDRAADVTTHRYAPSALRGDALRAALGLALSLGALAAIGRPGVAFYIFAALTLLFGAFALQIARRALTTVTLDAEGIRADGPAPRALAWRDLSRVKLSYFRTRRRRGAPEEGGGYMQLKLSAGGRTLSIESHIDGFETIARRAHEAARGKGLALAAASADNFAALGVGGGGWGPPGGWSSAENRTAS